MNWHLFWQVPVVILVLWTGFCALVVLEAVVRAVLRGRHLKRVQDNNKKFRRDTWG